MHREETYAIDNEAQLFFVAPYWTSTASVGMAPEARPRLLGEMCEALNAQTDQGPRWVIEEFAAPRTLKFRRHGQLWRRFELHEDFLARLEECLGKDIFAGYFARLTYFDYGIGCVEISLACQCLDTIGIEEFSKRAACAKLMMVESFNTGMAEAMLDLPAIDGAISQFLKEAMSGLPNRLRPTYDSSVRDARAALFCGPVSRNIIFTDTAGVGGKLEVTPEDLSRTAFNYLNEADEDGGYTGSEKIPISHEGFEGAVAVIRRNADASERVRGELDARIEFAGRAETEQGEIHRTKLLWSLVHTYWSALFCASEGFFSIAATYGIDERPSLRKIQRELAEIDEYKKIVAMIKFESQPERIIVEGEDRTRYAAVWKAYDSEESLRSLDQILEDSTATLQSLRDRAQKIIQARTTRIFTAFTLLTLLSVISDLIVLYDVDNEIDGVLRLLDLALGASLLSFCALAFWGVGAWLLPRENRPR